MLPAFHGSFACWFRVRQLSRAWVVLLKRNTSLNFASIQYCTQWNLPPHPVKVANKGKFLGIPYTKKYNLYTLILLVAGILGGGGDICTQVLEHAAALERSSTQNRAALMRSSCVRKNCRLMGFGKTHRIHRTGIFVPIIHLP